MDDRTNFGISSKDIPVTILRDKRIEKAGIKLMVKREDLIHSEISGNKWRKLKYNLLEAQRLSKGCILTFGGAYSNHIHATAAAGQLFGLKTIGIIRGEPTKPLNPTLRFAIEKGMKLQFVSRFDYRNKENLLTKINFDIDSCYIIPEGGTNSFAIKGTREIVNEYDSKDSIDTWAVCCGTGGTIAGMITALKPEQKALGISVLKGKFLQNKIEGLLFQYESRKYSNWTVNTEYHFGGYARFDNHLIKFINEFKERHQIQLDPIYTGKLFYGIYDLMEKGYFQKGSTIMAIHSGGIQGIKGFNERFEHLIN